MNITTELGLEDYARQKTSAKNSIAMDIPYIFLRLVQPMLVTGVGRHGHHVDMGEERGQEIALGRKMEVLGVAMSQITIGSHVMTVCFLSNPGADDRNQSKCNAVLRRTSILYTHSHIITNLTLLN